MTKQWDMKGNDFEFFKWLGDKAHKTETYEEALKRLTGYARELKKAAKQGGGKKT